MSVSIDYSLPRENHLLAALPTDDYQRLIPHLELVALSHRQILYDISELIRYVYFPHQALISFVSLMEDGSTTEVGIVGKDGMVGMPVCWGGECSGNVQAIVQMSGNAMRMKAEQLKTEFKRGGAMQSLLLLYTQAVFAQVAQTAACNRHHTVEERLARWLLTVQDQIQNSELVLTQEFISQMLGTRRSGVTVAAMALQQAGIIRYSRGRITVIDREKMKLVACECYDVINNEFSRLLGSGNS